MPEITKSQALDIGRAAIHQEALTLQKLEHELGEPFWHCARLLIDCPGLVWITAVGTSAAVGMRFAHVLTCSGARAMFLSPSDGLHGHTNIMQPEEVLVAMSRGGESQEVIQMVSIANQLGVKTIGFVHDLESSLARSAQYLLPIQSPQEYELMGYLATTSTVAYSAVCDALCNVLAQAKGFAPQPFAKVHPGGAVGQVLAASDENRKE
jgi:arabinose-5-phosphate isomerase